ncbi:MAG: Uncharacterized protein FD120_2844, partial [Gammaproteobacteria bacterium]
MTAPAGGADNAQTGTAVPAVVTTRNRSALYKAELKTLVVHAQLPLDSAPMDAYEFALIPGLKLFVYSADLATTPLDAVVNATDFWLENAVEGTGSISAAGGYEYQRECRENYYRYLQIGCSEPRAVVARGRLPCHRVIHAVGPGLETKTYRNARMARIMREQVPRRLVQSHLSVLKLAAKL